MNKYLPLTREVAASRLTEGENTGLPLRLALLGISPDKGRQVKSSYTNKKPHIARCVVLCVGITYLPV